jgi:hypothetical protein
MRDILVCAIGRGPEPMLSILRSVTKAGVDMIAFHDDFFLTIRLDQTLVENTAREIPRFSRYFF